MPNIALPAMGIDQNGVATPAPIQVWNEFTGQYQSSADTTPGVMPGPIGGLGGLLAGENPVAPAAPATDLSGTSSPSNGAFQQNISTGLGQLSNPFSNPNSVTAPAQVGNQQGPVAAENPFAGQPINWSVMQDSFGSLPPGTPTGPALGGIANSTQNLLNPQGAAQINPKVNFASAIRPGVKANAFDKFGTPLNQVRQSPGMAPQSKRIRTPRPRLPRLLRPR